VLGVHRRTFLHLAGGAALASCRPRHRVVARPTSPAVGIRAIAFDLFTLFDPGTVDRRVAALLPGVDATAFATAWKSSLFQYSWLRASAGRYVAFDRLVVDALEHAARTNHVTLAPPLRDELAGTLGALELWPDASSVLHRLSRHGMRLASLANFAPAMISALLASARVTDLFEHQLSTDAVRTYKPDPRAYALAERAFVLPRQQIAFAAFGGWDAAGASWFGLPTFWVNRLGVPAEQLDMRDVAIGRDLDALVSWIDSHAESSRP